MVLLPDFLRRRSRLKPPPSLAVELPLGERKRSGVRAAAWGERKRSGSRTTVLPPRRRHFGPELGAAAAAVLVDWDLGVKRPSGRDSPWVNGRVLGPDGYALLARPNTTISS